LKVQDLIIQDHNSPIFIKLASDKPAFKMSFNGGKMQHIFRLEDNLYVKQTESTKAHDALVNGNFYVKIDGSNHLLVKASDGQWQVYERYDDRKGKLDESKLPEGYISLPDGGNPVLYQSKQQKHHYFYKLIPRPAPDAKGKLAKLNSQIYQLLDLKKKFLDSLDRKIFTVELVGQKFQKTPGVDAPVDIAIHFMQTVEVSIERTFDALKNFLEQVCCEGLVVVHQGTFWKVRSNCFDKNHIYEQVKTGKVPLPANFIKPVLLSEQQFRTEAVKS